MSSLEGTLYLEADAKVLRLEAQLRDAHRRIERQSKELADQKAINVDQMRANSELIEKIDDINAQNNRIIEATLPDPEPEELDEDLARRMATELQIELMHQWKSENVI